jgi:hypothetical protein
LGGATSNVGGSSNLRRPVTKRKKQTWEEEKKKAYERCQVKLGKYQAESIVTTWKALDKKNQKDLRIGDGMIKSLLSSGCSFLEVRVLLDVGGYRVTRMAHQETTTRAPMIPSHAFTQETIDVLREAREEWLLEEGFPCPHLLQRLYFVEENTTWKSVHNKYTEVYLNKNRSPSTKIMTYSTFLQYRKFLYPNVRLSRTKEDECDSCMKLNLVISFGETDEERENAKRELDKHRSAARTQRRAVSEFTKKFIKDKVPLPDSEEVYFDLPEFLDTSPEEIDLPTLPTDNLVFLAEDYGQGIAMPSYGFRRPGSDYFNSNLMMHLYVQSDITLSKQYVTLYDERCMGKGKDALCSLRLAWHHRERKRWLEEKGHPPSVFVGLYDNCSAQNKSNPTMKLACYLSLSFYEKVLLLYFIPGHTHMVCDRVVGWCKRSIKGKDIFNPTALVDNIGQVKGVKCTYIFFQALLEWFF